MRLGCCCLLVCALVALLLHGAPPASSGSTVAKRCATKGETVVETDGARVWRVRHPTEGVLVYFGCLKGGGANRRLGTCDDIAEYDNGCVYAFVLSGRFVAYDDLLTSRCCGTTGNFFVTDLRTGGRRRSKPLGNGDYQVVDDVVTPRGSAAWIRQEADREHYRVHRLQNGKDQVLDRGTEVEPTSLRRRGHRVYWRHAGETRSARLK
jgi:hypothetical protein